MKILAIRGCNLASLAGEFEIDLVKGPLGMAGVFAIVGPTGAGKSTLLDAMCVALFDRTPRLPGHSRVVVGHGDEDPLALGSQDPRTLLRRGAAQGWAEVDFESGDARRYRARWSVRRARGSTEGNLQDQQVTFMALDEHSVMTERLGGTKTETLKAIHQRLGLTFDQFRRSALLAQGDFAAFLRAEGRDRSELLERMTGTEIYTKLSIAAHQRSVLAVDTLKEQQASALAIAVLDPEIRAVKNGELEVANVARETARHRLIDAEKLAHWRGEAQARAAALTQAQTALELAEAEARGADALRSELELRRRAEALRGVWDEAARVDRQHSIARGELARAENAEVEATAAKTNGAATRARVAELHAVIRAARIAAGLVERDNEPFGSLEQVEQRANAALASAAWLGERKLLAAEIASWPELSAKLAQERALVEAIAAADRALADHAIQHTALADKAAAAERERATAQQKLTDATRESESFVKRRTLGLDAAGRAEDDARATCAEVERLVAISSGAREAANVLAELESRSRDLEIEATADRERRANGERDRDAAALLREERARVVAELRNAAGYQHARTELVAGEPCPLCGAEEHPWKDKGAFDTLIASADELLIETAKRWETATKLIAQLDARDVQRDAERVRFASTRVTAQTSVEALAREWRTQLSALGELSLVTNPADPEAERLANERTDAARVRLEAARATRSAAAAAHKAIAEAQSREKVCQTDLDHHQSDLRELAAALASLTVAVERVTGERAGRVERHAELSNELAAILARWAAALPAADREQLGLATLPSSPAKRTRAKKATSATDVLVSDSSSGDSDGPRGPSAIDGPRGHLWIATLATARFGELVETWQERAAVVARAEAALVHAHAELDRAQLAADRAVADAAARHAECGRRSRELAAELVTATEVLDAARTAAGFDREALHRALADDPSRVEALAAEIDRLNLAVDRAATRLAERQRHVADHEAAKPTPRGTARKLELGSELAHTVEREPVDTDRAPESLAHNVELDADRVPELTAAVKAADERAAQLVATLAADDEARRRRDAALTSFAAAERAAEVDRVLGEVIGSHDGKLFRSFAQSLTLDQLLFVANSHLEELAPRYQLERVPKHDLELQVIDRDFGGEVRSVQSLSGGESFLVSLALALGLSSMSAHDVRVRTLLIDEGFGTLDPATLDSALAVLDELQASGRQVGIISHVPALLDRVRAHVRVTPRGGGRSDVDTAN